MFRALAALLLAAALAACSGAAAPGAGAAETVSDGFSGHNLAADSAASAQNAVREAALPAIVATRELVQVLAPPRPPAEPEDLVHSAAVALIVAFEVSSPAHYERRLRRPIWPGGASGATWGLGFDGGHQTRAVIAAVWTAHDHVSELVRTAGVVGQPARALVAELQHVDTPWGYALEVFEADTLPEYHRRAKRAFSEGWDALPRPAQGALVSVVYNRGTSMLGDSRREMRHIRDRCVPAGDVECVAAEIRSMCRLWQGTPLEAGLCRRREAEAALAETDHGRA